jgi:hypothetical protein
MQALAFVELLSFPVDPATCHSKQAIPLTARSSDTALGMHKV